MQHFLQRFFLFLGIASLAFSAYVFYLQHNPNRLEFADVTFAEGVADRPVIPTQLVIPSLDLSIPIITTENLWETTDRGVSYVAASPLPGEVGNTIMYGHNWASLLGKLPRVQPGDTIEVLLSNGQRRVFTVETTQVVTPDQSAVLAPSDDIRLTIYTCTGLFDSKRFVVASTMRL